VGHKIRAWEDFHLAWLADAKKKDLLVIHFETLRPRLADVLRRASNFLAAPADERRIACVSRHAEGRFKRWPSSAEKRAGMGKANRYTPSQAEAVRAAAERVSLAMVAGGQPPLPLHLYQLT